MRSEDFIMPFGKYRGKTLIDILDQDAAYLDWLAGTDIRNPALAAAVADMNLRHQDEIDRAISARNED